MVRVYSGAPAGVVGILQGVQKRSDVARACRWQDYLQPVDSSHRPDPPEDEQLEGSDLESRAGRAGSPFDVGATDGGSGAERLC